MSVINSGNFSKALYPGVLSWYGKAYNEYPMECFQVFEKKMISKRAFEEVVSQAGLGLLKVKGEGAPITYDTEQQGFVTRFTHVEYGLGFMITKIMMEDDLYDVVGEQRAKNLGFSVRQTQEIVSANVLNRAFNSSYTYGDGKELCSDSHPNISGGTWSNINSADLSEAALEQAIIDIGRFTNDRGFLIAAKARRLVVPVDLQFDAERILGSNLRVGTANNDLNAVKSLGKLPDGFFTYHYLEDPDAWFVQTDVPNGLTYMERRAPEFTTDNDWDTENAKFKVTTRFSVGCIDPRSIYGSPGA
jgi:hypothetical protein